MRAVGRGRTGPPLRALDSFRNMDVTESRLRQRDMGIERCRQEKYEDALPWLTGAFEDGIPEGREWAVAASYLGFCMARLKGKREDGIRLCRHALRAQVLESEIWLNLARVHLLGKDRKSAVEALEKGLSYAPEDRHLRRLRDSLGTRQAPPIRFLPRSHFLNRALGKMRGKRKPAS